MYNRNKYTSHRPGYAKRRRIIGMPGITNKTDLHIHSIYSDGSGSPEEIVNMAADIGLRAISLTDHDTVDGIAAGLAAAGNLPQAAVTFIPGVEISADYTSSLHIIGYFRPDNYMNIDPFLDEMKSERHIRNLGIIKKLNELGIRVSADEVAKIAGKTIFGRPHIAAALVKKGVVTTPAMAFNEYLSGGRKAYVSKRSRPPDECVSAIAEAGGLPVIAHPSLTGLRLSELETLAKSLARHGLSGLEAYYPEHTPKETENYVKLAESLNLLATGGSDFHGEYRKHIRLGEGKGGNLLIPDAASYALLSALNMRL